MVRWTRNTNEQHSAIQPSIERTSLVKPVAVSYAKRASVKRALRSPPFIVLSAALVVIGLIVGLVVDVVNFTGPGLSVSRSGEVIVVESRFLEYELGIGRVRLEDLDDDRLGLEATSSSQELIPRARLSRGMFDALAS
jgi:hypothetical protein